MSAEQRGTSGQLQSRDGAHISPRARGHENVQSETEQALARARSDSMHPRSATPRDSSSPPAAACAGGEWRHGRQLCPTGREYSESRQGELGGPAKRPAVYRYSSERNHYQDDERSSMDPSRARDRRSEARPRHEYPQQHSTSRLERSGVDAEYGRGRGASSDRFHAHPREARDFRDFREGGYLREDQRRVERFDARRRGSPELIEQRGELASKVARDRQVPLALRNSSSGVGGSDRHGPPLRTGYDCEMARRRQQSSEEMAPHSHPVDRDRGRSPRDSMGGCFARASRDTRDGRDGRARDWRDGRDGREAWTARDEHSMRRSGFDGETQRRADARGESDAFARARPAAARPDSRDPNRRNRSPEHASRGDGGREADSCCTAQGTHAPRPAAVTPMERSAAARHHSPPRCADEKREGQAARRSEPFTRPHGKDGAAPPSPRWPALAAATLERMGTGQRSPSPASRHEHADRPDAPPLLKAGSSASERELLLEAISAKKRRLSLPGSAAPAAAADARARCTISIPPASPHRMLPPSSSPRGGPLPSPSSLSSDAGGGRNWPQRTQQQPYRLQAAFAAYEKALDEQSLKSITPVKLSELLAGHMALLEKLQRAQWDRLRLLASQST